MGGQASRLPPSMANGNRRPDVLIPAVARESRRPAVRPSVARGDFTISKQEKSLWRRGELGCPRGLKRRRLLILRCADNAKNAVIANPSYVKLTWNELGNELSSPERRFEFIPLWGFLVLLYAMRRVDCRRCGAVVEEVPWGDTHLNQSLHVVPGAFGAPPVLERNRRSVSYFLGEGLRCCRACRYLRPLTPGSGTDRCHRSG
jgi:hypothetical protein